MSVLDFMQPKRPTLGQRIAHRKAVRKRVWERDSHCVWCREEISPKESTVDHVIPQSLGGPDHTFNLVRACFSCNNYRSNRSALDWYRICISKGLEPDAERLISSLQEGLQEGCVGGGYSLYYVAAQLHSPEFAPYL